MRASDAHAMASARSVSALLPAVVRVHALRSAPVNGSGFERVLPVESNAPVSGSTPLTDGPSTGRAMAVLAVSSPLMRATRMLPPDPFRPILSRSLIPTRDPERLCPHATVPRGLRDRARDALVR